MRCGGRLEALTSNPTLSVGCHSWHETVCLAWQETDVWGTAEEAYTHTHFRFKTPSEMPVLVRDCFFCCAVRLFFFYGKKILFEVNVLVIVPTMRCKEYQIIGNKEHEIRQIWTIRSLETLGSFRKMSLLLRLINQIETDSQTVLVDFMNQIFCSCTLCDYI